MHVERLQRMVTMLRGLPEEKFDITNWDCGTAACAVGHACLNPIFNEQGLWLSDGMPAFQGDESWWAVERFFEIDSVQSGHLFYGPDYPNGDLTTAAEVADRIEAFIAGG
ncbi:hypothetical protein AB4Y43_01150 [Paraburkholderia sp. BR10872]|uniref:hypothetical protein n=1 Tax=Paraburkholderia sp. BR10872 TaxID=3236989 RepID=UPI0034D3521D